jgi:hypothetical protein
MGADQVGTLERFTWLRMERIEPLIATHRGRVFSLMGAASSSNLPAWSTL